MDSVAKHGPYEQTIFIVDQKSADVDYSFFEPSRVVFVRDVFSEDQIAKLTSGYNIIELNTAVKASCFKYLFSRFPESEFAFYLDPDTKLFNSLSDIEKEFQSYNFLLTPHILTANTQELQGKELAFLKSGIYNLGFLGLKNNCEDVNRFIDWWEYRLFNYCYISSNRGLFVDQKWVDYLPCLFDKVKIIRNPGYNMAPWNISERNIEYDGENIVVNSAYKLYFFHFSNYNPKRPAVISRFYGDVTTDDRADLKVLYEDYYNELINNKYKSLSVCSNELKIQPLKQPLLKKVLIKVLSKILNKLLKERY